MKAASLLAAALQQARPRPSPSPMQLRDQAVRRDHGRYESAVPSHEEVIARAAQRQAWRRSSIPQTVERPELGIADQGCDLIHRYLTVESTLRAVPPNPRIGFGQEGGERLVPGRGPRVRHDVSLVQRRPRAIRTERERTSSEVEGNCGDDLALACLKYRKHPSSGPRSNLMRLAIPQPDDILKSFAISVPGNPMDGHKGLCCHCGGERFQVCR
jgi:hypothetical protein